MNEEWMERRDRIRRKRYYYREHSRRWVGVFLLIVGGLFLARTAGVAFPRWLFTWQMLLIALGLFTGLRHGFRGFGWVFPILIGGLFLADECTPDLRLKPYIWPIALMVAGLMFVLRPRRKNPLNNDGPDLPGAEATTEAEPDAAGWQEAARDGSNAIDITAIFGGVKKNFFSKNFKGGDITTFMGGAEINLLQADFNGRVMLDCFNMFGGTKLIVPADWQVHSGIVSIFGGIEDKRPPVEANANKILYLDGTCIFGGIEIKSF